MTTMYEKYSKLDKRYVISYIYDNKPDEEYIGCCACCGHLFEDGEIQEKSPTEFKCPYCSNDYETISIPDLVDTVYNMIEDNCEVIIRLWDETEYTFKLNDVPNSVVEEGV